MANYISAVRFLLALAAVLLLEGRTAAAFGWALALTVGAIAGDGLDGYVARCRGESSPAGAVLDVVCDRAVELTYWIAFAVYGWIGAWVPVVVAIRGTAVDAAHALEAGGSPGGRPGAGHWVVRSRWSRAAYGTLKAVAFGALILAHTPAVPAVVGRVFAALGSAAVLGCVAVCLVRGWPALWAMRRRLGTAPLATEGTPFAPVMRRVASPRALPVPGGDVPATLDPSP